MLIRDGDQSGPVSVANQLASSLSTDSNCWMLTEDNGFKLVAKSYANDPGATDVIVSKLQVKLKVLQ